MRPERLDLRPERLDFRPEKQDLRPERPDSKPERPDKGGGDKQTDKPMDKLKSPCSTGLCPLLGRCPRLPYVESLVINHSGAAAQEDR